MAKKKGKQKFVITAEEQYKMMRGRSYENPIKGGMHRTAKQDHAERESNNVDWREVLMDEPDCSCGDNCPREDCDCGIEDCLGGYACIYFDEVSRKYED